MDDVALIDSRLKRPNLKSFLGGPADCFWNDGYHMCAFSMTV